MEGFSIHGVAGRISFVLTEVYRFPESTGYWGGSDLKAGIKIKAGNFSVESGLYSSTGELYELFQSLEKCNQDLRGTVKFSNYEHNLTLVMVYDQLGHINISGSFSEMNEHANKLIFAFKSDQTFIANTLRELSAIVDKYGDMKGVKAH